MELAKKSRFHSYNTLMRYARMLRFGELHTKIDPLSGLHAIIAIHSTKLGPAIGGTRFYSYSSFESAIKDALRLSYGMTLKAAACGLSHGGAKAVIIKPRGGFDRQAIFKSFGDFVHELNGRYITAVDVGTTLEDMTTIFERTPFVCGASGPGRVDEDPSPSTARGVFRAIQAAVKFKFKKDNCNGIHVAIQGIGRVGFTLARQLVEDGARVTVSDMHADLVAKCVKELTISHVPITEIENVQCDIFSPCAMGGTITSDFIHRTQAKIIAGAANNQLAHHNNAHIMQTRNIIYLPDFLINSGGLINAATTYSYQNLSMVNKKVDGIYDVVMTMLERAKISGKTTNAVAEEMAFERLK
ncbi:MAG: hypothetical protein ACD_42C00345G0005 [uncultured bacterium]|nr:MAG: hypothetical protein ACD_42C00345G0005 [uncultured bacterium]OGT33514.1 MAG: hypothetical protein A3C44_01295 [Gammaproteobacteria bacterium RIFCSPHIGHO2_02_FULL_39_13]OGT49529.1 MAG: hypothetical protein A3E53_00040 [Gammaproteobacteria bacterium RIFCSPHIGHO2_12_FULL_39_24]